MLINSKISQYKIRKILKCFTNDCTAKDVSKIMTLNIKTITRYYSVFRKIILQLIISRIKINPESGTYIGYIRAEYGTKGYFSIYKMNKKVFLISKLCEKPDSKEYAMHDRDFNNYLGFLYKRFGKFRGLTNQAHYYQLFESILRYNYSEEGLFNLIWDQLQATKPKIVPSDKSYESVMRNHIKTTYLI